MASFAFALANLLPGIVVLAALGSNVYWISLVAKLRSLMGDEDGGGGKPEVASCPPPVSMHGRNW